MQRHPILTTLLLIIACSCHDATAATRPASPRGHATTSNTATSAPAVSARATIGARTAPRTGTKQTTQKVAARSATPTTKTPGVVARAATTQKVIGTGTKVTTATKNTVINETCQEKFNGCMDSFCMLDATSGGRCTCSDKITELDKILAEIEQIDAKSYQLATTGVETIETGVDIAAIKRAQEKTSRVDLSAYSIQPKQQESTSFIDKTGLAKFNAAAQMCLDRIPECESQNKIITLIYTQKIKSDCSAFENSLKQRKIESIQKQDAAGSALRSAALEQYENANKYDLGQCTVEFKKCMQTTADCGDDFSACATIAGIDNSASTRKSTSGKTKNFKIKGEITDIEISASTYDALMAKKPICENITKSCVKVAGQVWDTFLREVAPQVKNAELIAENNARQDCIGNISSCFQKACKDNIDPKDPDGSYDMCLTRPGTMLNLCKVPLNTCGIDSSSESKASENPIWDYVLARLAAMRVDACTTAVKDCLTDENVCGDDYTQCIGLDTDTIIRMCPYDKLVACQQKYGDVEVRGDAVYDQLSLMVRGLMTNIDNSFLTACQNAANESMLRVCGSTDNCNKMTVDDGIGARALKYQICEISIGTDSISIMYDKCRPSINHIKDSELGRVPGADRHELGPVTPFVGNIDGIIYWESVNVNGDGRLTTWDEYAANTELSGATPELQNRLSAEVGALQKNVDRVVDAIESDPTVQFCMTGRTVPGMKDMPVSDTKIARFPNLTKQMRMIIANSALKTARENYLEKYDELNNQMLKDYGIMAERMAEIKGENGKDARRESARKSCIALADLGALPKSPAPPKNAAGTVLVAIAIAIATAVITFFTMGAGTVAIGVLSAVMVAVSANAPTICVVTGAVVGGAIAASATGAGIAQAVAKNEAGEDSYVPTELSGRHEMKQYNYHQIITTDFDWENLNCHKCVETRNCSEIYDPLFGTKTCKTWEPKQVTCTDIQF